jgi:hypothetical protein
MTEGTGLLHRQVKSLILFSSLDQFFHPSELLGAHHLWSAKRAVRNRLLACGKTGIVLSLRVCQDTERV